MVCDCTTCATCPTHPAADRRRRVRQDRAAEARTLVSGDDARRLRAPVAGVATSVHGLRSTPRFGAPADSVRTGRDESAGERPGSRLPGEVDDTNHRGVRPGPPTAGPAGQQHPTDRRPRARGVVQRAGVGAGHHLGPARPRPVRRIGRRRARGTIPGSHVRHARRGRPGDGRRDPAEREDLGFDQVEVAVSRAERWVTRSAAAGLRRRLRRSALPDGHRPGRRPVGPAGGSGRLVEDTVVVVERSRRGEDWVWPIGLEGVREKRYGETMLFYGRVQTTDATPTPPGSP